MSVTSPAGFVAAASAAGIKPNGGLDLALVAASDGPVTAAGVFTRNSAAAAPVRLSRSRVRSGRAQAVVLNSGCANAGTGIQGEEAVRLITASVGEEMRIDPSLVLAGSTGPIGSRLDPDRIGKEARALVPKLNRSGGLEAAEAILTTDSHPKTVVIDRGGFTVGGMAKGAGMLRPDMATMLCLLTTDARIGAGELHGVLTDAVAFTFNALNVDGCESTNDSVIALASGVAGPISSDDLGQALTDACSQLAEAMAADAEGASRVVHLEISGAEDRVKARQIGRVIADSALVRASFYGGDPNWGRVLAAMGTLAIDPVRTVISYQGTKVFDRGNPVEVQPPIDLEGDFTVSISVGDGMGHARVVTTDLTPQYVEFNGGRS